MSLASLPELPPEPPPRPDAADVECLETSTVVYLSGELDLSTLDEERRTMARAISLELPLVVDLSGVEFMDATTIGLLMRSAAYVHAHGRSLTVRDPSHIAARLLTICGLDHLVAEHAPIPVAVGRAEP